MLMTPTLWYGIPYSLSYFVVIIPVKETYESEEGGRASLKRAITTDELDYVTLSLVSVNKDDEDMGLIIVL